MRNARVGFGAILVGACCVVLAHPGRSQAQAIGFQPGVGVAPDGVAMTAIPAVSADRRYVRVSVDAQFSTIDGFQNIGIPFGVSGFGGLGSAGAGLGLGGAAGGAAGAGLGGGGGAGLRSVGLAMGMDGPLAGGGMGSYPAQPRGGFSASDPDPLSYATAGPRDDGSRIPTPRRARSARSKPATSARTRKATAPGTPATPPVAKPASPNGR